MKTNINFGKFSVHLRNTFPDEVLVLVVILRIIGIVIITVVVIIVVVIDIVIIVIPGVVCSSTVVFVDFSVVVGL